MPNSCVTVQVDGTLVKFLNANRPSRRPINLHASWALKKMRLAEAARSDGAVTLEEVDQLSDSAWSGGSCKSAVQKWLDTNLDC